MESPFEIQKFVREVRSGDYDSFFLRLQSFFADTTYEAIREQELHYENVLFIVFKLVGFYTQVEYHTSKGRIDLVLQTDKFIYVIEFKLDGTAEEALQQIHDKHYALPFASDGRKLFKIGVNFSAETRNIEKWIVEEWKYRKKIESEEKRCTLLQYPVETWYKIRGILYQSFCNLVTGGG